jgi:hypothetical protein
VTPGIDPLTLVVDDAVVAGWNNEGLPSDRMSTENATILTTCERWPLMIDPQLQGMINRCCDMFTNTVVFFSLLHRYQMDQTTLW